MGKIKKFFFGAVTRLVQHKIYHQARVLSEELYRAEYENQNCLSYIHYSEIVVDTSRDDKKIISEWVKNTIIAAFRGELNRRGAVMRHDAPLLCITPSYEERFKTLTAIIVCGDHSSLVYTSFRLTLDAYSEILCRLASKWARENRRIT